MADVSIRTHVSLEVWTLSFHLSPENSSVSLSETYYKRFYKGRLTVVQGTLTSYLSMNLPSPVPFESTMCIIFGRRRLSDVS